MVTEKLSQMNTTRSPLGLARWHHECDSGGTVGANSWLEWFEGRTGGEEGPVGSRDRFLLFQGIVLARESPHVQLLLEHLMNHLKSSCGPHGLEIYPWKPRLTEPFPNPYWHHSWESALELHSSRYSAPKRVFPLWGPASWQACTQHTHKSRRAGEQQGCRAVHNQGPYSRTQRGAGMPCSSTDMYWSRFTRSKKTWQQRFLVQSQEYGGWAWVREKEMDFSKIYLKK